MTADTRIRQDGVDKELEEELLKCAAEAGKGAEKRTVDSKTEALVRSGVFHFPSAACLPHSGLFGPRVRSLVCSCARSWASQEALEQGMGAEAVVTLILPDQSMIVAPQRLLDHAPTLKSGAPDLSRPGGAWTLAARAVKGSGSAFQSSAKRTALDILCSVHQGV